MQIKVKRLTDTAILPAQAHNTDAGFDVYANEDLRLDSAKPTGMISTGIAMAIPEGYYGRLKGRSGLTAKSPLRVQEGTIDAGYLGEIKIIVDINTNIYPHTFQVNKGDRIAQLIICKLPEVSLVETNDLGDSERADGGFGSTGVHGEVEK